MCGIKVLVEEEIFHIYNRGVDKRAIYADDSDRIRFLFELNHCLWYTCAYSLYLKQIERLSTKGSEKSSITNILESPWKLEKSLCSVMSYCLMPNHYHLALIGSKQNISKLMQRCSNGYTKYFNERHKRSGCLFQGKYKNVLIESREHLGILSRYIHRNPIEAGLIKSEKLRDYRWSSFSQYVDVKQSEPLICETKHVMSQFESPKTYSEFVKMNLADDVYLTQQGFSMGN